MPPGTWLFGVGGSTRAKRPSRSAVVCDETTAAESYATTDSRMFLNKCVIVIANLCFPDEREPHGRGAHPVARGGPYGMSIFILTLV